MSSITRPCPRCAFGTETCIVGQYWQCNKCDADRKSVMDEDIPGVGFEIVIESDTPERGDNTKPLHKWPFGTKKAQVLQSWDEEEWQNIVNSIALNRSYSLDSSYKRQSSLSESLSIPGKEKKQQN